MSMIDRRLAPVALHVDPVDHQRLAVLAEREGGLSLGADKDQFLVARLSHRVTALELPGFAAYADYLSSPAGRPEIQKFIEALTTHTTSFFRGPAHFAWLEQTGFKDLHGAGREITIWSAACSSGQELYSAMILATELAGGPCQGLRVSGIGTDLSNAILRKAATSVYFRDEIDGLSEERRRRFLLSSRSGDGRYRIVSELRDRATWRAANLTQAGSLGAISADVAFLRNVLIYFDDATKNRAVRNVVQRIRPGGVLITGPSETLRAAEYGLEAVKPSIYRKVRG